MIIKKYISLLLLLSLIGQTSAMENDDLPAAITTIDNVLQYVFSRMSQRDETLPIEQLSDAISNGNTAKMRELLDQGIDPNTQNCIGIAPLHVAASKGNLNACKLLIQYGANLSLPTCEFLFYETPLHCTLSSITPNNENNNAVAVYLIEELRVNINTKNRMLVTPLHLAAQTGNPKILKLLLQKGIHTNTTDIFGSNALHSAAFPFHGKTNEQSVQCIVELLRCGVDYKAKNKEGKTPAQYATNELVKKALKDDFSVKQLLISGTSLYYEKNLCIAVREREIGIGKPMRHKEFDFECTKTLLPGNK